LRNKLENKVPYLYILPALFVIVLVIIYPTVRLIVGSFFTRSKQEEVFAGINNFRLAFKDPLFSIAIKNNFLMFLAVPLMTILSVIIASILYNQIAGWQFYRSIIFVPYILSVSVVGIAFSYILQYRGVLNTMLRSAGLEFMAMDWLGRSNFALGAVTLVVVWKQLGFGVVLMLARMMSIDVTLYEAAEIDGANWWQNLFHVTIPQARHVIEFYVIISLIDMLSWIFGYIYTLTSGGPGSSTYVLEYLIYKKSFGGGNMHIAQTYSVVVLFIAGILTVINQFAIAGGDGGEE
jgi:ABC-type sugar transport system permease subunit